MAKNIDFMGATFPDVPSIRLPQHEGGLVSFDDTSDGDITASDVAQGKIGYAQGQKIVGTAVPSTPTIESLSVTENGTYTAPSGVDGYSPVSVNVPGIVPSGSQTVTENGTYDVTALAEMIVNVAGGGGLEYEGGTWTPTEDIPRPEITFNKSHNTCPILVAMTDTSSGWRVSAANYNMAFICFDIFAFSGNGYKQSPGTVSTAVRYGFASCAYVGSSSSSVADVQFQYNDDSEPAGKAYSKYWVTPSAFYPYSDSSGRYWKAGRTYKWIAVWAPTS